MSLTAKFPATVLVEGVVGAVVVGAVVVGGVVVGGPPSLMKRPDAGHQWEPSQDRDA